MCAGRHPAVRLLTLLVWLSLAAAPLLAQSLQGVVVDQTELPLPGARVELHRGATVVTSTITAANGTFELGPYAPGDTVEVGLDGFETATLPPERVGRIVLALARATETTEVHASALGSSGATMERVGSSLTSSEMLRMPVVHPRALETLPRLPTVVRGPDGVLHIGGTLPHEGALLIDGFDVTDPVTGFSAIDLPVEAVKGVAVIRDPMSVTFGQSLGGLASIETVAGPDNFVVGVQGFIPRPRLSQLGFGRIEAFFPRAYVAGRHGPVRYFAAQELSFERVPVPGVTTHAGGPNIGETSALSFGRVDVELSSRNALTFEGIFVPGHRDNIGLSPLRDESSAPSARTHHIFAGVIDRLLLGNADVVTIRVGTVAHGTAFTSRDQSVARLTPYGWRDNWFSSSDHWATRQSAAVQWDHSAKTVRGSHVFTASVEAQRRAIDASFDDNAIRIEDVKGVAVRLIRFAGPVRMRASDWAGAGLVRDLWDVTPRLQIDGGLRVDYYQSATPAEVSPRFGLRYALDPRGRTVLKAGAGRFVGRTPIAALTFGSFPARTDTIFDPATGVAMSTTVQRFRAGDLNLPRADSFVVELEQEFGPGFSGQVGYRQRFGSQLPDVIVPASGGDVSLESHGASRYRELQISVRRTWGERGQVTASYVRAASESGLNNFGTLFTNMDTPVLRRGGQAASNDEVLHRMVTWGTVTLPRKVVVSPAIDWHAGFPYSLLTATRDYAEPPNSRHLPNWFSLDLTVFKGFDIRGREVDLGLQVFNLTAHDNPRDVYAVTGTPGPSFTNSVGRTFGGYMVVRWDSRGSRRANGSSPTP